jgi:hypothetical protein
MQNKTISSIRLKDIHAVFPCVVLENNIRKFVSHFNLLNIKVRMQKAFYASLLLEHLHNAETLLCHFHKARSIYRNRFQEIKM